MKKLLSLTLISLFFFSLQAQDEVDKPNFISLNVGPSLALKDYQSMDSLDPVNTNIGLALSIESGFFLNKYLGLGLSVGGFINPIDRNDLANQYQTHANTNGIVTAQSEKWVNVYGMVGPYLSFGGKIIRIDLKFLMGAVNSSKPEVTIEVDEGGGQSIKQVSAAEISTAFGYNYGAHLRLNVFGPLGIRINVEGISTRQQFDNKVEYVSSSESLTTQEKMKTELKNLNLSAGLILNF